MQETNELLDKLIKEVENNTKNNKLNDYTFNERLRHIASTLKVENNIETVNLFIKMCNDNKIAQEYAKNNFENVLNQLNSFKRKYNDIMTKETEEKEEVQENMEEKIEINKEEYVKDLIKDTTKMVNVTNNLNEFINGFNIIDCLVGILSGDEKYFKKNTKPLEFSEQEKKDILNEIYNGIDESKKEEFLNSLETMKMSQRLGITKEDIYTKENNIKEEKETEEPINEETETLDTSAETTTPEEDSNTDIDESTNDEELIEDDKETEKEIDDEEIEEDLDEEELTDEEELEKPVKFRHKVVKVVKNTHEWFKKHPKIRILAIGLAILATLPLTAQPIMMVFSTLWRLCQTSIVLRPLCPLLHGLNTGLAPFVQGGKFAFDLGGSGLYTLAGAPGAQAMYTAAQAAIFTGLASLGVAGAIIARKIRKKMKGVEIEEPIPEPKPEPTPENDEEKEKTKEQEITNDKDNKKGKDGYNPELTDEQIKKLKEDGLEPGDPEYITYLYNYGITPRPEDYIKRETKKEVEYDSRLTKDQIDELKRKIIEPGSNEYDMYLLNHGIKPIKKENESFDNKEQNKEQTEQKEESITPTQEQNNTENNELVAENERLKEEISNLRKANEVKDKKYNNLKSTLAYVMKELEELKLKQNKEPLQIAENEEMSRGLR